MTTHARARFPNVGLTRIVTKSERGYLLRLQQVLVPTVGAVGTKEAPREPIL